MLYLVLIKKIIHINFCYFCNPSPLFPLILMKIAQEKTILIVGASIFKQTSFFEFIIYKLFYALVDFIIVSSPELVDFDSIQRFHSKIIFWDHRYIDPEKFKFITPLEQRDQIVGFVGIMNKNKGIHKLIGAIPKIVKEKPSTTFLIVGDGPLFDWVKMKIEEMELKDHVQLTGWVPRERLYNELNKMKLLVVPSEREGFPKVVIEAIFCGTPVLATPVGGIPDLIKEGKTGFILRTSKPSVIAKKVLEILDSNCLNKVAHKAQNYARIKFNYNYVRESYKKILPLLGVD